MFTPLPSPVAEQLQLGEGLLLINIDVPALMEAADPGEAIALLTAQPEHVLGAADEGCVFRCVRQTLHTEKRGQRTPTRDSTLPAAWDVSLSGTLTALTPDNLACMLDAPAPGQGRLAVIEPHGSLTAPDSLCWIGATSEGVMLIELRSPLSTGGLQFRSAARGAGRTPFTFAARQHCAEDAAPPCTICFMKDGDA